MVSSCVPCGVPPVPLDELPEDTVDCCTHPALPPRTIAAASASSQETFRRRPRNDKPSISVAKDTAASEIRPPVPIGAGRPNDAVAAVVVTDNTDVPDALITAGLKLHVISAPGGGVHPSTTCPAKPLYDVIVATAAAPVPRVRLIVAGAKV